MIDKKNIAILIKHIQNNYSTATIAIPFVSSDL